MFTEKDIQIGTVLKYRGQTDSYKYFRILNIFDKELEWSVESRAKYFPNSAPDYIPFRPRQRGEYNDYHYILVLDTDFEMATSLAGPWVIPNHTCELVDWGINCDIIQLPIQLPEERVNRLDLIDP